MTPDDRAAARTLALAVLVFGGLIAIQLVPLPPAIWAALPGREFYHQALVSVDLADRWRPWSMSPDLTLDSLLSLLPVLAATLLFTPLDTAKRRWLLDALLACLAVGAMLSVLQIVAKGFYPYGTDPGVGVGFFANRNHHALYLAVGIVLIFGRWKLSEALGHPFLIVLTLTATTAILPFLIVLGSRAGLVAGVVAFVGGALIFARSTLKSQNRWVGVAIPAAALGLMTFVVMAGALSQRQLAIERLLSTINTLNTTELRTANLPAMVEAVKAFFPVGAGFNTFDPVFRRFEGEAQLHPDYFNRAHSEPIELLIEGGLPALFLLGIALVWLARQSRVMLVRSNRSATVIYAQVGVFGIMLLLAASLVDYPMRTPFFAVLTILFAGWIAGWRSEPDEAGLAPFPAYDKRDSPAD